MDGFMTDESEEYGCYGDGKEEEEGEGEEWE